MMSADHILLAAVGIALVAAVWPREEKKPEQPIQEPEPAPPTPPTPLVPDDPDARDYFFEPKMVALPDAVSLQHYLLSIEDQQQTGSCTANAATSALELLRNKLSIGTEQLSRLFLYYVSRTYENKQGEDKGTQLRFTMKALHNFGVCNESLLSFDPANVNTAPSSQAFEAAKSNCIKMYKRVRLNNLREAVAEGNPVIIGMYLRNGFGSGWDGYSTKLIYGSHAMVIVGYDDRNQTYLVANSWGGGWDGDGLIEIPYFVIAQDLHDAWVIEL